MAVQRIALVCVDPWMRGDEADFRPFNYSARKIQAALETSGRTDLEVRLFDVGPNDLEQLDAAVAAFDPDLLAGSAYVWSFPTLVELARRARRRRASCAVVLGGPSARQEMFTSARFSPFADDVDALVLGEGEEVAQELVRLPSLDRETLGGVSGLAVRTPGGFRTTEARPLPELDRLASPYQLGLAPRGVSGHLETFRGCPLSCTFCQWGDLSKANRTFSVEYLRAELRAFRELGMKGVFIVDAALNLNAGAFRNLMAADEAEDVLRHGAFNTEVYPSHVTDQHLAFLERIGASHVGIGLQSYDREVLRRMQRPFDETRFEHAVRDVAAVVPDTTVEIILGLPGDEPASFRRTVERARRLPVSVRIFKCLVLPNALMTRAPPHFRMRWDEETLEMRECWGWSPEDLRETEAWLDAFVAGEGGETDRVPGSLTWKLPRPSSPSAAPIVPEVRVEPEPEPGLDPALLSRLRDAVARASEGRWSLGSARTEPELVVLRVETPVGSLTLDARAHREGRPSFRAREGVAFSYRAEGASPGAAELAVFDRLTQLLASELRDLLRHRLAVVHG